VKTVTNSVKPYDRKVIWWTGLFLLLVTSYFNSKTQDPFNSPKFWVLLLGAAWLLGYPISFRKKSNFLNKKGLRLTQILLFLFIGASTLSLLAADNKQIAFFGDNMRKNGYLTYLALAIFFLAIAGFINSSNVIVLYHFILLSAYVVGGYGLLQMSGNDFINWSASGMALFSTLGNSNFAGSAMAILAILSLGGAYIGRKDPITLWLSLIAFVILSITIFPTNARQGLLLLAFGVISLLLVLIYNFDKKLGLVGVAFAAFGFTVSILGMLQIGPLERFLYKDSVSVRGYYWRAGIEMFRDNPLFGVGLDNYGSFFKEYREVGYPLKYGYSLTSTNAHNVFIQHFATGGIFVGTIYLILTAVIFWRGVISLRKFEKDERVLRAVFFIAWLAFQAQSLISIDNIGIGIWGWVLGGVVVGLSVVPTNDPIGNQQFKRENRVRKSQMGLLQPIISASFTALTLVLVVFLYRADSAMFQQRAAYNPAAPAQKDFFYQLAQKTVNAPLQDLQYKVMTATYLHGMGFQQEALNLLEQLHVEDPYNLDALTFLASYYENLGQVDKALVAREKIAKLDPWNANNYLQIAFNYKFLGNKVSQQNYLDKVLSFAAADPMVIKAVPELTLQSSDES
jgi:O-antigen ligase